MVEQPGRHRCGERSEHSLLEPEYQDERGDNDYQRGDVERFEEWNEEVHSVLVVRPVILKEDVQTEPDGEVENNTDNSGGDSRKSCCQRFFSAEVFVTQRRGEDVETSSLIFWGHIVVFSIYSGFIGYLLFHQEVETVFNLFYYALAMALHFSVTDYGLRRHHGEAYYRIGRWMLAGSTLVGGVIGFMGELDPLPLSMLTGFLAGAIVLNIIKEELPDLDESRFGAFAVGTIVYTLLIVLT
jgi:hypothetical protein